MTPKRRRQTFRSSSVGLQPTDKLRGKAGIQRAAAPEFSSSGNALPTLEASCRGEIDPGFSPGCRENASAPSAVVLIISRIVGEALTRRKEEA